MLSVIIPTRNSERAVVATLAALVSGATAGLIAEVILADGGSQDETAVVADVAGCRFMALPAPLAERLRSAVAAARAPWLLFLRPGTVPDAAWTAEAAHFMHQVREGDRAAVFRRAPRRSAWSEIAALGADALGARPRPEQGLLLARKFYDRLSGHADRPDPESDLLRRIGRTRISMLGARAAVEILD